MWIISFRLPGHGVIYHIYGPRFKPKSFKVYALDIEFEQCDWELSKLKMSAPPQIYNFLTEIIWQFYPLHCMKSLMFLFLVGSWSKTNGITVNNINNKNYLFYILQKFTFIFLGFVTLGDLWPLIPLIGRIFPNTYNGIEVLPQNLIFQFLLFILAIVINSCLFYII